ncbi:hypothetical protein RDWZM_010205 [Blomia tropicalis]|uniref:Uncharacterized protein n=1 Tax=Blomia tropicalis TaxID=40697 RepID=A0A9Q0M197_BLOTA|nr:hypothetical protein RDWZM_010205 [Blomia tropicalis]
MVGLRLACHPDILVAKFWLARLDQISQLEPNSGWTPDRRSEWFLMVKFDCRETYPPIMSHENLRDVSFTTNQSSTKKISWNIDFNDSQSGGNDQSLMNHEEDDSNALKNILDWECALNVTMNAHFENTL